jgi:hypothetical protein
MKKRKKSALTLTLSPRRGNLTGLQIARYALRSLAEIVQRSDFGKNGAAIAKK